MKSKPPKKYSVEHKFKKDNDKNLKYIEFVMKLLMTYYYDNDVDKPYNYNVITINSNNLLFNNLPLNIILTILLFNDILITKKYKNINYSIKINNNNIILLFDSFIIHISCIINNDKNFLNIDILNNKDKTNNNIIVNISTPIDEENNINKNTQFFIVDFIKKLLDDSLYNILQDDNIDDNDDLIEEDEEETE